RPADGAPTPSGPAPSPSGGPSAAAPAPTETGGSSGNGAPSDDGESAPKDRRGSRPSAGPQIVTAPSPTAAPAEARADEVDATIRLEQATRAAAQAAPVAAEPADRASSPAGAPVAPTGSIAPLPTLDASVAAQDSPPGRATPDADPMTAKVIRGMVGVMNQRGGAMTMRLDPPELGQLRIQMTITRGVVTAIFEATSQQAHALLDRNIATLRTALESQGLTVERLTVHSSAHANAHGTARDDGQPQHSRSDGRDDASRGQSRGRRDHDGEGRDPRRPHRFAGDLERATQPMTSTTA
ncbi:MAG: flagellar hook-length control protein FliK, partial [Phycisphaerales bacterium]|nr:flagellar hook-length control protein FliK [Phycisphaerales bacterium]